MLPKAFSRVQSLHGAPTSKNRRPVGLIRIYLRQMGCNPQVSLYESSCALLCCGFGFTDYDSAVLPAVKAAPQTDNCAKHSIRSMCLVKIMDVCLKT